MDTSNNNIGISAFVRRQTKGSGKTYSTLSFQDIINHAQEQLNNNTYKEGYRDGVILISVDKQYINNFICPIIKIDDNTRLESITKKRRDNEDLYISTKALNGKPLEIGAVDLILYRYDVLEETNERTQDTYWELIAFHAIPKGTDKLPMGPVTMMRNQLMLPGGTKGNYSAEEWAETVCFWQKYAILKTEE